ncbi:MAG TPA: hypothetical protein VEH77_12775 [Roseiarcus sp.]|nr:hypothetical protein [Roseiarcus sp.]
MASATHSRFLGAPADRAAPVAHRVHASLKKLARRLGDMLEERRQREVDEVIARLLERSGGSFTDSLEREIMRKVLGSDWRLPM